MTLIGATTENPYFEVNSALLSRAQVYELQALDGRATSRRCCGARWSAARGEALDGRRRGARRSSPRARAATRAPR